MFAYDTVNGYKIYQFTHNQILTILACILA